MFHSRAARNVRGYQAQQKLASSDPDILRLTPLVPQPLLFLGKRAEAAKLPFVDYRGFGGAPRHARRPLAEYIAGTISEEEMLKPWTSPVDGGMCGSLLGWPGSALGR